VLGRAEEGPNNSRYAGQLLGGKDLEYAGGAFRHQKLDAGGNVMGTIVNE
jgi:hypothetical protein